MYWYFKIYNIVNFVEIVSKENLKYFNIDLFKLTADTFPLDSYSHFVEIVFTRITSIK